MASQPPSRFNDYLAPSDLELTQDTWNAVFGDIANRLKASEAKAATFDVLVQEGVGVAIERINLSLQPAVDEIAALIQRANVYLSQLQQTANGINATLVTTDTTHRFVSDTQLATLAWLASKTTGRSFFLSNA